MARGSESKTAITQKILDTFNGAFVYDKEIRIPMEENGESLQIKCVLTCAKTNVDAGGSSSNSNVNTNNTTLTSQSFEITDEEKKNVDILIETLGL